MASLPTPEDDPVAGMGWMDVAAGLPETWYGWTTLIIATSIILLWVIFRYVWKEEGGDDDDESDSPRGQ